MTQRPANPQRAALLQTPVGQTMHKKAVREVIGALTAHGVKVNDTTH
jgi:hypothetical protein